MKMNNIFVKLLVSILIVLTLVNFISSTNTNINYCFAETDNVEENQGDENNEINEEKGLKDNIIDKANEASEKVNSVIVGSISSFGSAIMEFFKSIILAPFRAARSLNYLLASSGGVVGDTEVHEITPFDIFFNRFTLLDANIFSTTDRDGNELTQDSLVYKIRTNAAVWYYAIRTLAIAIIAIMLLWNLARAMSKNTSATQKVVAKNALTDWVLSFALVMFMHIIIIIVLNLNDILLSGIEGFTEFADTSKFLDALENSVFSGNLILGFASMIVYALLNWQTFKYILVYIQRLLTIVVLTMISPIVPITYSTNRMNGGRGGALNGWLKELLFNVFVQVLHAIVYASLVGVAMAALSSQNSIVGLEDLGSAVIAITAMLFVKYAEKMVKSIFGFDSSQVLNNNVIHEAATNVGHVAQSAIRLGNKAMPGAIRAANRVATGGPLVSFGQNVDGSHIGIGQVAQGLGRNAKNTVSSVGNSIKGTATDVRNKINDGIKSMPDNMERLANDVGQGIGNIPRNAKKTADAAWDGVRRTGNAFVSGIKGEGLSGKNNSEQEEGQKSNSSAEAHAEAHATASAKAEAIAQNGKDGSDGLAGSVIAITQNGEVSFGDSNNKDEDNNMKYQVDNNLNDMWNFMADDEDEEEKYKNKIEWAIAQAGRSDKTNGKEENAKNVKNEFSEEEIKAIQNSVKLGDINEKPSASELRNILGLEDINEETKNKKNEFSEEEIKAIQNSVKLGDINEKPSASELRNILGLEDINEETKNKKNEFSEEEIKAIQNNLKLDKMTYEMNNSSKKEFLNELKNGIEIAFKGNSLDKLQENLRNNGMKINGNLDSDSIDEIESNIADFLLFEDVKSLSKYINSLPKDSNERKYAENEALLDMIMGITKGDEDYQEKCKNMLLDLYKAQVASVEGNSEQDNITKNNSNEELNNNVGKSNKYSNKEEANVNNSNNVNTKNNIIVEERNNTEVVHENNNSHIIDIQNKVRAPEVNNAIKDVQEALVKLGININDETELQSDFEARLESISSRIKTKSDTFSMNDILNSLTPQAKQEYSKFKNGEIGLQSMKNSDAISTVALEREAKAIQTIEKNAQKQGFNIEVTNTKYEGSVNINGKNETFSSNSVAGVANELQNIKVKHTRKSNVIDVSELNKDKQKRV